MAPGRVQRSAQLMKGTSGAEAKAVGGGWAMEAMEEPSGCWCSRVARRSGGDVQRGQITIITWSQQRVERAMGSVK